MAKYVLMLNDMRDSNIENLRAVKVSTDRQELVDFYEAERVEPYSDGRWGKGFRQGGPLEWFNSGDVTDEINPYFGGIYEFPDYAPDEQLAALRLSKA